MSRPHVTRIACAILLVSTIVTLTGSSRAVAGDQPSWRRYVLGPHQTAVAPTAVTAYGDVVGAGNLVAGGGAVRLKTGAEVKGSVLLDFGRTVSGPLDVQVTSGGPATLSVVTSESRAFVQDTRGRPTADDAGLLSGYGGPATLTAAGPGRLSTPFRGGYRWARLTLESPGTVTLGAVRVRFQAFRAAPSAYRGWFESSSDQLNRIWYAGAYTVQLNMQPAGTNGSTVPKLLDGAKRDRAIWTGDLIVQGPVAMLTLGSTGATYLEESLRVVRDRQDKDGQFPGAGDFFAYLVPGGVPGYYSLNYSGYGARAIVDHYRYTGDPRFARESLAAVRRAVAHASRFLDSQGLIVSNDRDYWQTNQEGQVTKYSLDYYLLLRDVAYLERHLGNAPEAAELERRAQAVRVAVIRHLWSPTLGAYPQSNLKRDVLVGDANALALATGVHPPGAEGSLRQALRRLWVRGGARIGTGLSDPGGRTIEPFGVAMETDARFVTRDRNALRLMRRTWGPMVDPRGPHYTGSLWEFLSPGGTVRDGGVSLAHGWSAGPTQQLTERVLGIRPVDPGYRTWRLEPMAGSLRWARGAVPAASGRIGVRWRRPAKRSWRVVVTAPRRTSGIIVLPARRSQRVRVDGRLVWNRGHRLRAGIRHDGRRFSIVVPSGRRVQVAVARPRRVG